MQSIKTDNPQDQIIAIAAWVNSNLTHAIMSVVYLLHFDKPLGNAKHQAQHYIGFAKDLPKRLEAHHAGKGAAITKALIERGGTFECVRVWEGNRTLERQLKARHNHRFLCYKCYPNALKNGINVH